MAHYTGSGMYFAFGGTAVVGLREVTLDESMDKDDVSHAGDGDRTYLQTLRDATMKVTWVADNTAGSATMRTLYVGHEAEFVFGPEGTAAGKPKYSGTAFVEKDGLPVKFDGAVVMTADLQRNSTWVDNFKISGDVFP